MGFQLLFMEDVAELCTPLLTRGHAHPYPTVPLSRHLA